MEPVEGDFASELEWPGYERSNEPREAAENGSDSIVDVASGEPEMSHAATAGLTPGLLPNLVRRIDDLISGLANTSMRIDALGAATSSLYSSLSDRLAEYGDTVTNLARSQAATIDEYRHGNDRTLAEIRRSVAQNEAVLHSVSGRADELLGDSEALADLIRETGAMTAARSDLSDAAPELMRGLALLRDEVHQLLGETKAIGTAQSGQGDPAPALMDELASLRDEVQQLRGETRAIGAAQSGQGDPAPAVMDELALLRDEVQQLLGETSAIGAARSDVGDAGPAVMDELALLRDEVHQLRGETSAIGAARSDPGEAAPALVGELASLRDEVHQLKRRIGLRARAVVSLDDDQLQEMADAVTKRLRPPTLDDEALGRIADAVMLRLEATLEVVPSEPEPKPAPARKAAPSRKATPAPSSRGR